MNYKYKDSQFLEVRAYLLFNLFFAKYILSLPQPEDYKASSNKAQVYYIPVNDLFTSQSQKCIKLLAYQYGVPTNELAGDAMEADPKSASFTCPGSVSRMFPALISLVIEYKYQYYSSPNKKTFYRTDYKTHQYSHVQAPEYPHFLQIQNI